MYSNQQSTKTVREGGEVTYILTNTNTAIVAPLSTRWG